MFKIIVTIIALSFFAGCGPKPCPENTSKALAEYQALVECEKFKNKVSGLDCSEHEARRQAACASAGPLDLWGVCLAEGDHLRAPYEKLYKKIPDDVLSPEKKKSNIDSLIKDHKDHPKGQTGGDLVAACPQNP